MGNEAPDPRTFKTWEDAFQYPIPVVRKLENQLRTNADENREKLRSLVGASYRSLLDTAETIIDMEDRMEQVESKLARMGQNCNSRALDRISNNALNMDTHTRSRDLDRYTFASQLSVLRNCPVVITRLMKTDGSYLLIAKVLDVSRLLHKALSQAKHKSPILDRLGDRLGSVRRKLLRRIDRRLARPDVDTAMLVESMCAYFLATRSTPTDVLRHFLQVRKEEITSSLKHGYELAKRGMTALKLCLQTCSDTQAIFPRRLADSLAKLKTQPLVQDPDVRELYELNLDIHDRWIGDEARNYTPWPRHDELQRTEAERLLHQWSKQAISAFLQGIKTALDREESLKEVASLRQELVETWILTGSRMAGVKSANVLDDLRDTMNNQLETIVVSRAQDLQHVVTQLTSALNLWPQAEETSKASLWITTSSAAELDNGAQAFKTTILNTYQGRDQAVADVVSAFDRWMGSVLEVKGIIKSMKEARWDDTFADDFDDSDDDLGDSKQTLLSDDDPRLLEEATQEALGNTLNSLAASFTQVVSKLASNQDDLVVPRAAFVMRVAREIGDRIPRLRLQERSTPPPTPFTSDLLKPLHSTLATRVVQPLMQDLQRHITAGVNVKSKRHILWEGHPPLPAQPSPSAFRFLQRLVQNMASYGSDLWSPDGVAVLKGLACVEVATVYRHILDVIRAVGVEATTEDKDTAEDATEIDAPETEAAVSSPDTKELRDQKLTQTLFDILYIQRFVGGFGDEDALEDLVKDANEGLDLDDGANVRLKKNASEYGRRTYLLFALLA
ncbi:hypothetical protein BDV95DRAFT_479898 [Massariosphaeria phaeospora]|uniref:Conserved oligomeric Golgi complex subunit 1 n=1 Tax=Massariosphaeria phaeospora TaxID=100035 RepID=A0A7C8MJK9_9PLEO|nr:hypothetical protein BDV95DRAFT_479898 [Massariosphaeria phaeospora]